MIPCEILKQAEWCYNYVASQFCHAQFYMVKTGVLLPAGICAAGNVFLDGSGPDPPHSFMWPAIPLRAGKSAHQAAQGK